MPICLELVPIIQTNLKIQKMKIIQAQQENLVNSILFWLKKTHLQKKENLILKILHKNPPTEILFSKMKMVPIKAVKMMTVLIIIMEIIQIIIILKVHKISSLFKTKRLIIKTLKRKIKIPFLNHKIKLLTHPKNPTSPRKPNNN
jgi:hypothetical protein